VAYLDRAQAKSYKDALNNLDAILDNTESKKPAPTGELIVDLQEVSSRRDDEEGLQGSSPENY
jgi:hypothetical protein